MNAFLRKEKVGFTLIEVLVICGIIGVLSSVILIAVSQVRMHARDQVRINTQEQLKLAFRLMKEGSPTGVYPAALNGAELGVGSGVSAPIDASILQVFPQFKADPSSTGVNSAYGYWYDSRFFCHNISLAVNQVVLITRVESPKNSNFATVCSSPLANGQFRTGANQNLPAVWTNNQLKSEMYITILP